MRKRHSGCARVVFIAEPPCPEAENESRSPHDECHDWIGIRRGRRTGCGTTFTSLPVFSLPYTHYSLFARCEALQHRFGGSCSWEKAQPQLKDADRLPDAFTVRRWSRGLDRSVRRRFAVNPDASLMKSCLSILISRPNVYHFSLACSDLACFKRG